MIDIGLQIKEAKTIRRKLRYKLELSPFVADILLIDVVDAVHVVRHHHLHHRPVGVPVFHQPLVHNDPHTAHRVQFVIFLTEMKIFIMGLGVCRFSPTGPGRLGGKAKEDQEGEGGRLGLSSPLLCLIVRPPIRYISSFSRALPSISLKMLRDKMR